MDLDRVENVARELLSALAARAASEGWKPSKSWNRARWTGAMTEAFIDQALQWHDKGGDWTSLFPCAKGARARCGDYKGDAGWIFDIAWLTYEPPCPPLAPNSSLAAIVLALESEFGDDKDEDDKDFLKLVCARAEIRVMVQHMRTWAEVPHRIEHYKTLVRRFRASVPGDRYLFALYVESEGVFAFESYAHR